MVANRTITLNADELSPQLLQELAPYAESPYTYEPEEETFCKLMASTADPAHAMQAAWPTRCKDEKQATRKGTILASVPRIQHRIRYYRQLLSMQLDVTTSRIMAELAAIAMADIAGIFATDGSLLHPQQIPRQLRAAIKEIEVIETPAGTRYKYKFHDKSQALKLLATVKGMDIEARKASAPTLNFTLNAPTATPKLTVDELV